MMPALAHHRRQPKDGGNQNDQPKRPTPFTSPFPRQFGAVGAGADPLVAVREGKRRHAIRRDGFSSQAAGGCAGVASAANLDLRPRIEMADHFGVPCLASLFDRFMDKRLVCPDGIGASYWRQGGECLTRDLGVAVDADRLLFGGRHGLAQGPCPPRGVAVAFPVAIAFPDDRRKPVRASWIGDAGAATGFSDAVLIPAQRRKFLARVHRTGLYCCCPFPHGLPFASRSCPRSEYSRDACNRDGRIPMLTSFASPAIMMIAGVSLTPEP